MHVMNNHDTLSRTDYKDKYFEINKRISTFWIYLISIHKFRSSIQTFCKAFKLINTQCETRIGFDPVFTKRKHYPASFFSIQYNIIIDITTTTSYTAHYSTVYNYFNSHYTYLYRKNTYSVLYFIFQKLIFLKLSKHL